MGEQRSGQPQQAAEVERDFEAYKLLLGLWAHENPIKTAKLQVLLVVNSLLVSAISISGGGFTKDRGYVYLTGVIVNLVWTVSIGRTALFQEAWRIKLRALCDRHDDDPRFSVLETKQVRVRASRLLQTFGALPSKWYLLFSPCLFAIIWLGIFLMT